MTLITTTTATPSTYNYGLLLLINMNTATTICYDDYYYNYELLGIHWILLIITATTNSLLTT